MNQQISTQEIENIAEELGWNEVELQHALDNLDIDYGDEWADEPENVMGAIMGCAHGG